ncbi:unnamed protein product [Calicophoron daubneyi]|uniref:Uncharacterized protein n=1 Tax=Calicophoron daubneyi TaxID=300641 RepID=A0AAV2TSD0_CALDB
MVSENKTRKKSRQKIPQSSRRNNLTQTWRDNHDGIPHLYVGAAEYGESPPTAAANKDIWLEDSISVRNRPCSPKNFEVSTVRSDCIPVKKHLDWFTDSSQEELSGTNDKTVTSRNQKKSKLARRLRNLRHRVETNKKFDQENASSVLKLPVIPDRTYSVVETFKPPGRDYAINPSSASQSAFSEPLYYETEVNNKPAKSLHQRFSMFCHNMRKSLTKAAHDQISVSNQPTSEQTEESDDEKYCTPTVELLIPKQPTANENEKTTTQKVTIIDSGDHNENEHRNVQKKFSSIKPGVPNLPPILDDGKKESIDVLRPRLLSNLCSEQLDVPRPEEGGCQIANVTAFIAEQSDSDEHCDPPHVTVSSNYSANSSEKLCWWHEKSDKEIRRIMQRALKLTPQNDKHKNCIGFHRCVEEKFTIKEFLRIFSNPLFYLSYFFIDCRLQNSVNGIKFLRPMSIDRLLDANGGLSTDRLNKKVKRRLRDLSAALEPGEPMTPLNVILLINSRNAENTCLSRSDIITSELKEMIQNEFQCQPFISPPGRYFRENSSIRQEKKRQETHLKLWSTDSNITFVSCHVIEYDKIKAASKELVVRKLSTDNIPTSWYRPPIFMCRGRIGYLDTSIAQIRFPENSQRHIRYLIKPDLDHTVRHYDIDRLLFITVDSELDQNRWYPLSAKIPTLFISRQTTVEPCKFISQMSHILNFIENSETGKEPGQQCPEVFTRRREQCIERKFAAKKILVTTEHAQAGITVTLGLLMLLTPCSFADAYTQLQEIHPRPRLSESHCTVLKCLNRILLQSSSKRKHILYVARRQRGKNGTNCTFVNGVPHMSGILPDEVHPIPKEMRKTSPTCLVRPFSPVSDSDSAVPDKSIHLTTRSVGSIDNEIIRRLEQFKMN